MVQSLQRKPLFTSFTNNARDLLLSTMQAATDVAKEAEKKDKDQGRDTDHSPPPPNQNDLHQPSLLSDSFDASLVNYTTVRSVLGNLLPQKVGDKKKKGRKKLMAAVDQLPDEAKSLEYKAFEAFLMSSQPQNQWSMDDLDLTGQEEPGILHAVIASLPSQQAYKEVHKFRRRPQYLEFLVHLSSLTLARGGQEKVMGWIQEAFQWLKKRNDIVLTPKPSQSKVGGGGHAQLQKGRALSARGSATALAQAKVSRRPSLVALQQTSTRSQAIGVKELLPTVKEGQGLTKGSAAGSSKALLAVGSHHAGLQKTQQVARRPSAMGKHLVKVGSRSLDVSLSVKITRDDIEFKAHILVATLLPELWRKHKCR